MLKKYLKYSAIALLFLFFIDRFLVSGTFDCLSWGTLFLAVIFLVHAFFRERSPSSMGKVVSFLLVPLSVLTNILVLTLFVLIAFNYPPTKAVEPRIKIVQPPSVQTEGYAALVTLLEEADRECYALPTGFSWQKNRFDHAFAGMGSLLNDRCEAERKRLLDFVSTTVTARPFVERDGQLGFSLSEPVPNYLNLVDLYRVELINVARLLDEGRSNDAFGKYLLLWQGAIHRLDSRDGLVNSMGSIAITGFLADLFEARDLDLENEQADELLDILSGMPGRLDSSLAGGLLLECAAIKSFMRKDLLGYGPQAISGVDNFLYRSLALRALRWPFFDLNAQLDFIDSIFADQIDIVYLPGDQKSDKAEGVSRKVQEISDHPVSLINPVGRFLSAMSIPASNKYDERKESVKAKMTALNWLLESFAGRESSPLPMNDVTGESFVAERQDGFLKISGGEVVFRVKEPIRVTSVGR